MIQDRRGLRVGERRDRQQVGVDVGEIPFRQDGLAIGRHQPHVVRTKLESVSNGSGSGASFGPAIVP